MAKLSIIQLKTNKIAKVYYLAKGKVFMAYKEYRDIKVYEASGYQYRRTPSIVLKGKWLAELGFDIGDEITVRCEDGRLIITKANEIWDAEV